MSHEPSRQEDPATAALPMQVLTAVGSIALLVAMAADAIAVAGRHLKIPLLGSIEIVQACVVLAASAATIGTTLAGGHMIVTLVTERLMPEPAARLRRLADGVAALFFAAVAAGSIWMAVELWGEHEISETLGIPFRWLRVVWCAQCDCHDAAVPAQSPVASPA